MLLQKRSNGIYYFRWVYPPALRQLLGKRELIKSLHSSSKTQALSRAGAYYVAVDCFQIIQDNYEKGVISHEQYEEQAYECLTSKLFSKYLDAIERYLPSDLNAAQVMRQRIAKSLDVIRLSKTNVKGEFEDGRTIHQSVIAALSLDEAMRPLKKMADGFIAQPGIYWRYVNDVVDLFHHILETLDEKLNPSLIKASPPKQLALQQPRPIANTAIRYAQRTPDAIAIIVSEKNTIDYCFMSESMKEIKGLSWIKKGALVPKATATYRFNLAAVNVQNCNFVEAEASFEKWFGVTKPFELYEEVKGLGVYGKTLTILSADSLVEQEELDEEGDLIDSWTVKFRK